MGSSTVGMSIWKRFVLPTSVDHFEIMLSSTAQVMKIAHIWLPVVFWYPV